MLEFSLFIAIIVYVYGSSILLFWKKKCYNQTFDWVGYFADQNGLKGGPYENEFWQFSNA